MKGEEFVDVYLKRNTKTFVDGEYIMLWAYFFMLQGILFIKVRQILEKYI